MLRAFCIDNVLPHELKQKTEEAVAIALIYVAALSNLTTPYSKRSIELRLALVKRIEFVLVRHCL